MKSVGVVVSLAAQLASWRATLILVRTWATCKSWQRKDLHEYSILLADCLKQSKQTVCSSVGGVVGTESRKVGKGRRKRRYADVDGPGANPEPELGPRGPTLKKHVLRGIEGLDLHQEVRLADSVDITQNFKQGRETKAGDEESSGEEDSSELLWSCYKPYFSPLRCEAFVQTQSYPPSDDWESMDPAGSPSSFRKVADTTGASPSSPSAAPVPGWSSFFCLGNGK